MSESEIISCEPATGAELWRGKVGDVDETVLRARRAWPQWAALPLAQRIELMRRFANEVRKEQDAFAELISKETGKPLWEARGEVESVVAKVEISARAAATASGLASTVGSAPDCQGIAATLLARFWPTRSGSTRIGPPSAAASAGSSSRSVATTSPPPAQPQSSSTAPQASRMGSRGPAMTRRYTAARWEKRLRDLARPE